MDGETKKGGRGRGRGRGRGGRGRGRGRGRGKAAATTSRGRAKKMVIESDEEEHEQQIETSEIVDNQVDISDNDDELIIDERENVLPEVSPEREPSKPLAEEKVEFNIDDDISQLVPPTFSTVSKGPPQPMLELSWDQKYFPVGEKLPTPNIHMCIACRLPIRMYGRLIPCKHVFCHGCAIKQGDHCTCCSDRVHRVEQVHLGTVFMCHHGGKRYGFDGCRRTYLSSRDLQAHVNHRHKPRNSGGSSDHHGPSGSMISPGGSSTTGSHSTVTPYEQFGGTSSSLYGRQNIPVHLNNSSSRSNLISVPLQAPSNSQGRSQQQHGDTPGSRYERKSSFNRNPSWSNYNQRPF